jgi:hypothetical protein
MVGRDVQHNAILIDCAPEIMLHALNADEYPVEMPLVSGPWAAASQAIGETRSEFLAPALHRLIGDDSAPLSQDQLHIAQAEAEHVAQPDGVADDLRWEPMTIVGRAAASCPQSRPPPGYRPDPFTVTMTPHRTAVPELVVKRRSTHDHIPSEITSFHHDGWSSAVVMQSLHQMIHVVRSSTNGEATPARPSVRRCPMSARCPLSQHLAVSRPRSRRRRRNCYLVSNALPLGSTRNASSAAITCRRASRNRASPLPAGGGSGSSASSRCATASERNSRRGAMLYAISDAFSRMPAAPRPGSWRSLGPVETSMMSGGAPASICGPSGGCKHRPHPKRIRR